ncbi:MAG: hypothetical protein PVJ57_11140 [Phycisphaerae bacterium]
MSLAHIMRTRTGLVLILCIFVVLAVPPLGAAVIYVDDDAPLGGNGESWATAHRYLQDALADATGVDEVRVAQGMYRPDQDEAGQVTAGDRTAPFVLRDGVVVYGGYRGAYDGSGLPADDRDVATFVTTLSGDLAGDDQPDFVNNGENSYHVLFVHNVDNLTVLDGVTVTGGNADGSVMPFDAGGGMQIGDGCANLHGCTFVANAALRGGGLELHGASTSSVSDCQFLGNSAEYGGGALQSSSTSSVTLQGSVFDGNDAFNGGAVDATGGPIVINDCAFIDNHTTDEGGGVNTHGNAEPNVSESSFTGNYAGSVGGGMSLRETTAGWVTDCVFDYNDAEQQGGGLSILSANGVTVDGCFFYYNETAQHGGGGLYNGLYSRIVVDGCDFTGNVAYEYGGALCHDGNASGLEAIDCTFSGNHALRGGSVSGEGLGITMTTCTIQSSAAAECGGGAYYTSDRAELDQCTFLDNVSPVGGGLMARGSRITARLCTFAGNSTAGNGGGTYGEHSELKFAGCTWTGNRADCSGGGVYVFHESRACLACSMFSGNEAGMSGGGLSASDDTVAHVANCHFTGNTADDDGGGANWVEARGSMANCLLVGNSAATGAGGGIACCQASLPLLADCTLSGNSAPVGGGLHCLNSEPMIKDNVFWDNVPGEFNFVLSAPVVRYCMVRGGWPGPTNLAADPQFATGSGGTWTANGAYNPETRTVVLTDNAAAWTPGALVGRTVRPDTTRVGHFLIVANGATTMVIHADWQTVDSVASWIAIGMSYRVYDYRLTAGSPCIDSGDNTYPARDPCDLDEDMCYTDPAPLDLDGRVRYHDDPASPNTGNGPPPLVDRGAYEFEAGTVMPPGPCPGDMNGDGVVNNFDISPFVLALRMPAAYHAAFPECDIMSGDANNDGALDNFDIGAFIHLLIDD